MVLLTFTGFLSPKFKYERTGENSRGLRKFSRAMKRQVSQPVLSLTSKSCFSRSVFTCQTNNSWLAIYSASHVIRFKYRIFNFFSKGGPPFESPKIQKTDAELELNRLF